MRSSNLDCLLCLLRHCLAQKFAVMPQNKVRWTSDKGQKGAIDTASFNSVLGIYMVGAASDCSHPNSIIFSPKQNLGFGLSKWGFWSPGEKKELSPRVAGSHTMPGSMSVFGDVHGPIRGPGHSWRWMMLFWPVWAWHKKQGWMQCSIHMGPNFRISNARGILWNLSQTCCQLHGMWKVWTGRIFQHVFLCLIPQTKEDSRCPLPCLLYTRGNSVAGQKTYRTTHQKN